MNCGVPPQLHPACIGNGPHVKCKCSQTSSGRKNGSKNLNHVVLLDNNYQLDLW